jgi:hypothetical protein
MFQPTLELGTSLLNSERDPSCHLIYIWQSVSRFRLFWVFFYKLASKEGEEHSRLWSRYPESKLKQ